MELNQAKLETILAEHKGRAGEVEALLDKFIGQLIYPVSEDMFKEVFNCSVEYYRHVGAIWILEGILHGKFYDWSKKKSSSEEGSGDMGT